MQDINPARVPTAQKPVYKAGDSLSVDGETLNLLCASFLRLTRRQPYVLVHFRPVKQSVSGSLLVQKSLWVAVGVFHFYKAHFFTIDFTVEFSA